MEYSNNVKTHRATRGRVLDWLSFWRNRHWNRGNDCGVLDWHDVHTEISGMRTAKKVVTARREQALQDFQDMIKAGGLGRQIIFIPRVPDEMAIRLKKPIIAHMEFLPGYGWLVTAPCTTAGAAASNQQDAVQQFLLAITERLGYLQTNRQRLAPNVWDEYEKMREVIAWRYAA